MSPSRPKYNRRPSQEIVARVSLPGLLTFWPRFTGADHRFLLLLRRDT
jgi:hypothetical protein